MRLPPTAATQNIENGDLETFFESQTPTNTILRKNRQRHDYSTKFLDRQQSSGEGTHGGDICPKQLLSLESLDSIGKHELDTTEPFTHLEPPDLVHEIKILEELLDE